MVSSHSTEADRVQRLCSLCEASQHRVSIQNLSQPKRVAYLPSLGWIKSRVVPCSGKGRSYTSTRTRVQPKRASPHPTYRQDIEGWLFVTAQVSVSIYDQLLSVWNTGGWQGFFVSKWHIRDYLIWCLQRARIAALLRAWLPPRDSRASCPESNWHQQVVRLCVGGVGGVVGVSSIRTRSPYSGKTAVVVSSLKRVQSPSLDGQK